MASHSVAYVSAILLFAQLAAFSAACSCFLTDFATAFYSADKNGTPLSRAKVLSSKIRPGTGPFPFNQRVYRLQVDFVWTGCAPTTPFIVEASTATNSAACGVFLEVGKTYILPLKPSGESRIGLCNVNVRVDRLTAKQKDFLDSRNLCCNENCRCANTINTQCFDSPCRTATPPCPEAKKCRDNFCNGCTAEWFKSDNLPACGILV